MMNTEKMEDFLDRVRYLEGVYKAKKDHLDKVSEEVKNLTTEQEELEQTEKVIRYLIDKLIQNDLSKMDKLVTYGLNSVYTDRDMRFQSVVQEKRKKLFIDLQTYYNGKQMNPSSKSSVQVIESAILRILSIIKLNKTRFMMMDESFGAVDGIYIENVSKLLSELSSKLGMDILIVTHNPNLAEHAKNGYEVKLHDNDIKVEKKI
jgi:chromosome segregation ATPase